MKHEKIKIGGIAYQYYITSDLHVAIRGLMPYNENIKVLKAVFVRNQKKIDSKKTTKEDRNRLIQVNKNIVNVLDK